MKNRLFVWVATIGTGVTLSLLADLLHDKDAHDTATFLAGYVTALVFMGLREML